MNKMLQINNLTIFVNKKPIVSDFNLTIDAGCVYALLGPNGSGKSTFAYALAGHPAYTITKGSILLDGEDITNLSPDKRARKGLFVAFQQVPSIAGLTVFSFLKESYRALNKSCFDSGTFRPILEEKASLLKIDHSLLERSLYEGFSGGEKKRIEMLQLLLYKPKLALLDEIDSGVDVDARGVIADALRVVRSSNPSMSIILISHYQHIFNELNPDVVYVMKKGRIVQSGNYTLASWIEKEGYQAV